MAKKYLPSNGTEGELFMHKYCSQCIHEKWVHTQRESDKKCDILSRTFYLDINDPDYPEEWQYKESGEPTCTKYSHWDWGNDRDGWNEPPPPEPYDPNQLLFPFMLDYITGEIKVVELIEQGEL